MDVTSAELLVKTLLVAAGLPAFGGVVGDQGFMPAFSAHP